MCAQKKQRAAGGLGRSEPSSDDVSSQALIGLTADFSRVLEALWSFVMCSRVCLFWISNPLDLSILNLVAPPEKGFRIGYTTRSFP